MAREVLAEARGFSQLPAEELEALAAIAISRVLVEGEIVFAKGDPADALYVVETGEVEIVLDEGKPSAKVLARRHHGELVGEMGFVDGAPRGATAVARGTTAILRFEREPFLELLERHPRLKTTLKSLMAERHAETVLKILE